MPPGFSRSKTLKVDQAEPGWIGNIVAMAALKFRGCHQGLRELTFGVGPHGEVLPSPWQNR